MKPLLAATVTFLVLATGILTEDSCHAQQNATSVLYTSFQGETFSLYPWYGEKIVLLTRSASLDATAMQAILDALDAAYHVYQTITGREPTPYGPTFLNGRSTVAEVPDGHTCGAGCGLLSVTGIEIDSTRFGLLYDGYVQHGQYDQALFYELGRNFWFYGSQLAALDPFVTGFAIANRFISMELAGLPGGPFNQLDFQVFKDSIVFDLLDSYLADPTLNWENTLEIGVAPPNPFGWSAADLAGAMFYRIFYENGSVPYHSFYEVLASLPHASSAPDAVNNFIKAAFLATGRDYTYLFCQSACSVLPSLVDIKPRSSTNGINPHAQGRIAVAILGTSDFDAAIVDPTTVRFGRGGSETSPVDFTLRDVNKDGYTDLLLYFRNQHTGIQCGDTSAFVTGQTFRGQAIEGFDSVKILGGCTLG